MRIAITSNIAVCAYPKPDHITSLDESVDSDIVAVPE